MESVNICCHLLTEEQKALQYSKIYIERQRIPFYDWEFVFSALSVGGVELYHLPTEKYSKSYHNANQKTEMYIFPWKLKGDKGYRKIYG